MWILTMTPLQVFNQENLISLQNDFKLELYFEFQAPRCLFCTLLLPETVYPGSVAHTFGYYVFCIQLVHRQEIKTK